MSFEVAAGEVFALLGPNGAGKTTIVEILEGFRGRDSGTVKVLGFDPAERSTTRALRERLGIVLQELATEPFLTVREVLSRNAGFYPDPRRMRGRYRERRGALDALDRFAGLVVRFSNQATYGARSIRLG